MNIVGSTTNSYNLGSIKNPVRVSLTNNRFAVLSQTTSSCLTNLVMFIFVTRANFEGGFIQSLVFVKPIYRNMNLGA